MTLPPSARHPRLCAARPTAARIRRAIPAPPRRSNNTIHSVPPTATQTHRAHNPAPSAWTQQARIILAPKSQAPQGGAR